MGRKGWKPLANYRFDGDLDLVVLIFHGIVRSFKGFAEMTATDRPA
jgi:hypothetical protein